MALKRKELQQLIQSTFPNADILIKDLAGDNDHWGVEITSSDFVGKTKVMQHKMVYQALKGKMGVELHALQLKTKIP